MTAGTRKLVSAMLLGVLLYGVFIAYTGINKIAATLDSFRWAAFGLAIGLASLNYLLRFGRWEIYLRILGIDVPRADSLLVFLSGFVLTVSPGKVGEVFKSVILQQTHGVPIARTAPIVIAERLSDLIGVVLLIVLGSAGFSSGLPWAIAGTGVVLVGLAVIIWEKPLDLLLSFVQRHPRFGRFEPKLREAVVSLRLLCRPSTLGPPLALSVLAWASEGMALWVLLRGFGTSPPLILTVFFYETASLAGALIPLPGGLGIVETMIREQLVVLGKVPVAIATSSMLLVRLATLWWAVLVGFLALAVLRRRHAVLRGVPATP
ncbi:MAG TPA: lysylphosphatidylglycerol synthase transmembrane domain-containing protein [Polyangiaceae bacterium]|nr:lysylphosphatidylglycerol synthase transmembrane domain-containing protein [Polyangiaceae bacterium]